MTDEEKSTDLQNTVEDALGLNFRSLKTLRDLFLKPNTVFRAYAERGNSDYTPSLRLWFGLVGVQVIISTLWGGWSGQIRRQIETAGPEVQELYERLTGGNLDAFYSHYGNAIGLLQPIAVAVFSGISVFMLRWFNPSLSWPSRLNIAMGVLVTGTAVGLVMMTVLMVTGLQQLLLPGTLIIAAVYFQTFLRGAPGVLAETQAGAFQKAAAYAALLLVLVLASGVFLGIVSMTYALMRAT